MEVVMVVTVAFGEGGDMGVMAARDGEWGEGSSRSGGGEYFWVSRKRSSEKFSGGGCVVVAGRRKEISIEFEKMIHKKFQMSFMGELTFFLGLQLTQKDDGIFISQDKPNIMFVVCACARFQVTHKVSHLHVVKRIFRYLKCQPELGLWYPKDSPFYLEAYIDSDYAGASLDNKSTTRGCQFLRSRLISWQCKKQIVVANSTTEVEYVAAANCCGQVLWI
nr:hypothetical protein [Tanacetum cinerariifolium]